MRGAFEPSVGRRTGVPRRVMLVDDVLTTGATAAACADALVRAGVDTVVVLSRRPARSPVGAVSILGRALNRVCGCPGIFPGSRRQPRAKRPT